ncbi:MAG: 2-C-methyl-D-erythritol 2,4-cyclodiphosphate synthase [Clostridiales Family XIII bacterium]|nr:2-C-methyl-D-erythritol 2,4-cyclodiphosphate synthase [Clostridiales Family XIII bacterium]
MLGGVEIAHARGLLGHSDADVLTHALMDALLGAAALGDIGKMFPDTAPEYAGISSLTLLEKVMRAVRDAGYELGNADITVVAQQPKLAPHTEAMRERLAGALAAEAGQISVKATTTEGMGFTGREEGIAAHAAVLLWRRDIIF